MAIKEVTWKYKDGVASARVGKRRAFVIPESFDSTFWGYGEEPGKETVAFERSYLKMRVISAAETWLHQQEGAT